MLLAWVLAGPPLVALAAPQDPPAGVATTAIGTGPHGPVPAPVVAPPRSICQRHGLLLAQTAPAVFDPARYLVSEKLDGVRACWDGRVLHFRSGAPVPAPDWFVARLPPVPLDGELWLGRGRFEDLSAGLRRGGDNGPLWRELRFVVFELPGEPGSFEQRAERIERLCEAARWPQLQAARQFRLADTVALQATLDRVLAAGGEGLMLHRADAAYVAGRQPVLLKLKRLEDAEAVVLGHRPGRGRHAGRLGALEVRTAEGLVLLIGTGFSDAERASPPPPGSVVTYSFRGRTARGLPRFASFVRVRDEP
ncbi:DNA ligase-1 [Sphaerotilus hippei]|uniref:DNA ligase-1 n=1 Tax=Sphaerotilus hippei TaxID=744406 RepID=A0A318H676_9BURK|nr:DNA ligase [Sphaerotilus hippei]PXW92420.1 DNA ligase-1 [Sphaerotilus hippei]